MFIENSEIRDASEIVVCPDCGAKMDDESINGTMQTILYIDNDTIQRLLD